jgi:putative chitinase
MVVLSGSVLHQIAPPVAGAKGQQQAKIIQALDDVIDATLRRFGIDNDLRRAHFLAQICHESDGFCTTVEYASGKAYEGRADLGNTEPGDGVRYKGRGLIQLTGRANYRQYGNELQCDLVGDPDIAAQPAYSLLIACAFWTRNGLNSLADLDDIERITRRINGGLNGLADRRACLARAKAALARQGRPATAAETRTILRRGDRGGQVAALQSLLCAKGFAVAADGDFGSATDRAVRQFQASLGLVADGVVGPQTWHRLQDAA